MIRVRFEEPGDDPRWVSWCERAKKRRKKIEDALAEGRKARIDDLYKEQRDVFLAAFHEKCAYCEAKVTLDQHAGDVEHYRPKGRVTDENGKVLQLPAGGGLPARPHPGYPWLAYDARNLLPSCRACNQPGSPKGKLVGKWDQFPVGRFRASAPGEESREKPLLLHPVDDDPEEHLVLDPDTGILGGKTKRGKVTIKLLDLNREGLPEQRQLVFISVESMVLAARLHIDNHNLDRARRTLAKIDEYRTGAAPWSWAGRLALDALGDTPPPARDRAHEGRSRTRGGRRREPGRIR